MLKKLISVLEAPVLTAVSGIFLVLSFILSKLDIGLIIDFAWFTVIISGLPLVYSAIKKLLKNKGINKISSALLISIAMIASICIGDLFAAGEVAFIMAIGEILEDMTTARAKKGLKKLIALAPVKARKIENGEEKIILAENIAKGDIIKVLPGETIAVDGIIVSGETSIDQSVITGESLPADKTVGDAVFCGTLNCFGAIDIKATNVGEDSSLQKLIKMVKNAEKNKAPMARTADKSAAWLVPAALVIAIITGILTRNITRAVTVLVVFCPCALVLATPTAIMAAIGQATKHGIMIKSGEALENMSKVDTLAFDKTGTLTLGTLNVSDVISFDSEMDENTLITLAASAESKSEHPLAKAILSFAKQKELRLKECERFEMTSGKGISAVLDGEKIFCGNERYIKENGFIITDKVQSHLEKLRTQGKACILVASEGKILGVIALSDMLREESKSVISALKKMNVQPILLSGDNRLTAKYFAKNVGISETKSELLPEQKAEIIKELQSYNKTVCMLGDGVNDAPALKTANVGIAMGCIGSDITVEAADIALMNDDLSRLSYLKQLSRATVNTIKFSITLSMLINILAVLLSIGGLLNPTTGALVHNLGACFVVMLSALLYDRKIN